MNRELHNITEPSISANKGWQEMQHLLNQHLPVKEQPVFRTLAVRYAGGIIFLAILLLTSLELDQRYVSMQEKKGAFQLIAAAVQSPATTWLVRDVNKRTMNITKLSGRLVSFQIRTSTSLLKNDYILPVLQNETGNTGMVTANAIKINAMTIGHTAGKLPLIVSNPVLSTTPANTENHPATTKVKTLPSIGSWNLSAGIGINASFNSRQSLRPYPVIEAKYNISPSLYVSMGFSAWSPVSTNTSGVSKMFYQSDANNNFRVYNEITSYKHLYYADIPLSLGINIAKNISIQSGIQVSALLNTKIKKTVVPYDYQSANLNVSPSSTGLYFGAGAPREYDVPLHNIDCRLTTGVRYSLNRSTIGLTYQHSLRPIGKSNYINTSGNQVIAVSMLWRIK